MNTPSVKYFKLSDKFLSQTNEEEEHIPRVPYFSVVDSIIYTMVYTRPNISQVVSIVNCYVKGHGKAHYKVDPKIFEWDNICWYSVLVG